jgi:hypothetical protein
VKKIDWVPQPTSPCANTTCGNGLLVPNGVPSFASVLVMSRL